MVEIEEKYKIYEKKFGYVNWIGFWTLYKKEVLRFLKVVIQTIISPLVTSLLFLMVLSLAIGNDRGEALGFPFITFLAPGEKVKDVHQFGGTFLGSSRGGQDVSVMVDTLEKNNVNMLFTIGGDGTLKGANAIGEEISRRGAKISVVGIPKTIDNDIDLIDESFGFETAFDVASPILRDAHNEATGAYNGISIIKLMGRDSGFIAASAALAMPVVNFVLIPEMNFTLEGENGFLKILEKRLKEKKHSVIVVAEGAGQQLFEHKNVVKDASGNI